MKRYLPSEKLSDEYLASERERLRKKEGKSMGKPFGFVTRKPKIVTSGKPKTLRDELE